MSDGTPEPTPSLLEILDLEEVPDEPEPDVRVEVAGVLTTGSDAQPDPVDLERLCEIASQVLRGESVDRGRLDLHLVDLSTISELNAEHMGATGPTDVLAFPLEMAPEVGSRSDVEPGSTPSEPQIHLGDVVICPAIAVGQAAGHTGSIEAELALLTIHGVLHVLGHDHAEAGERRVMQARERRYLEALGFSHPVPGEALSNEAQSLSPTHDSPEST